MYKEVSERKREGRKEKNGVGRVKKHILLENLMWECQIVSQATLRSLNSSTGINRLISGVAPVPSNLSISSEEVI